ncbi:MAG: hypothetical protein MMC33_010240 [Icmadophila ericetorum]|nr:hypothetical protein [Icmadophila ericetorum]
MSYEDLEEARAKRAEKETAKEAKGKGKRGRKVISREQHVTSGADVVVENAEDEITVRGIESQWTDPQLGPV